MHNVNGSTVLSSMWWPGQAYSMPLRKHMVSCGKLLKNKTIVFMAWRVRAKVQSCDVIELDHNGRMMYIMLTDVTCWVIHAPL
jgi:hypothetical protein